MAFRDRSKACGKALASRRTLFLVLLCLSATLGMSATGSAQVASNPNGYACGNFCDGYYGKNWTVSRSPIVTTSKNKSSTTGEIVSVNSGAGFSLTYTDEYSGNDCGAFIAISFTRYGPPSYYNGMITGTCIISGPNGLVEASKPASNTTLVPPTPMSQQSLQMINTIEQDMEQLATNNRTTPPAALVNAILAFSTQTSGCTRP